MAIEAAREAEAEEAAAAAQAEEDARTARAAEPPRPPIEPDEVPIEVIMAHIQLNGEERHGAEPQANHGQRRPRVRLPPRVQGAANAVRNHERNRAGDNVQAAQPGARRQRPLNDDERHQQEIQRFVQMAQQDEEDGWNSDDLGDDDEGFVIR